jgi:hypothetical protein
VTGRRTRWWRRWLDRLRARPGDGAAKASAADLFTAHSRPLPVANRPPNASDDALGARDRSLYAPPVTSPPTAPPDAEAAAAPDVTSDVAPPVRVHEGRLDRRVGPMELSPGEAMRLAGEGPRALVRRRLPPDTAPADPSADDEV